MTDPNSATKLMVALTARAVARQKYLEASTVRSDLETQVLDAIQAVRNGWAKQRDEAQQVQDDTLQDYEITKNLVTIALNAHDQSLMEALHDTR